MTQDKPKDWRATTVERIQAAIAKERDDKGMSQADLAKKLGVSRNVITNLETRKPTIDVPELLRIADALEVPPLQLLFPNLADGPVEVVPGKTMKSWEAAFWFSGEDGPDKIVLEIHHTRRRQELRDRLQFLTRLWRGGLVGTSATDTQPIEQLTLLEKDLRETERHMREMGMVVEDA